MEFGSIEFLLYFLPLFLFVYRIVPEQLRNMMLLIGSIIFCGYKEPMALVPLAGSAAVNYLFGAGLAWDRHHKRHLKRKILLFLGVVCNVGALAAFKLGIMPIEMPPGISFYTFSMISYLVDVYRRETPREMRFLYLANYAAMFSQTALRSDYALRGAARRHDCPAF